jgi:hypothetical protein
MGYRHSYKLREYQALIQVRILKKLDPVYVRYRTDRVKRFEQLGRAPESQYLGWLLLILIFRGYCEE